MNLRICLSLPGSQLLGVCRLHPCLEIVSYQDLALHYGWCQARHWCRNVISKNVPAEQDATITIRINNNYACWHTCACVCQCPATQGLTRTFEANKDLRTLYHHFHKTRHLTLQDFHYKIKFYDNYSLPVMLAIIS